MTSFVAGLIGFVLVAFFMEYVQQATGRGSRAGRPATASGAAAD